MTQGAAKLTSLLTVSVFFSLTLLLINNPCMKGLAPRVVLVEEAGQVLEAHVLGTLVPSIEVRLNQP
jgi:hypothetical protein